jgi:undecaprenyl-diphosphatase
MSVSWTDAAILGLVQGLTEFLPVSSSAHLRILGEFLPSGTDPGAAFTAITQLGTETAVLVYFWKDIISIATAWLRQVFRIGAYDKDAARMGWLIIIGSLPIIILGLAFKDQIEHGLRNMYITAVMLIVFGLILGWADRIGTKKYALKQLIWRDGIIFGFAQAMALIPGVSRSGGTITAGLFLGLTRPAIVRYSFVLAIPSVFGAGLFQLKDIGAGDGPSVVQMVVAVVIAGVVGYAVIAWLLKFVQNNTVYVFVAYRIALGVALLAALSIGAVSAT